MTSLRAVHEVCRAPQWRTRRKHGGECETSPASQYNPRADLLCPRVLLPRCNIPPGTHHHKLHLAEVYTIVSSMTNKPNSKYLIKLQSQVFVFETELTLKGFKPRFDLKGYFTSRYPDIINFYFFRKRVAYRLFQKRYTVKIMDTTCTCIQTKIVYQSLQYR